MTQVIVNGLYLGAQYALIALGLTLIFALMNVLNFAHGQMYVFGGFITYTVYGQLHLPFVVALACSGVTLAIIGALFERLLFRTVIRRSMRDESTMLLAAGTAFFLDAVILLLFGEKQRGVPKIINGVLNVDWLIMPYDKIVVGVIALVLIAVFVPLAFISGLTGQFYKQFALTIAISTVISAVNSLTLSPALAALLLKSHDAPKDALTRFMDVLFGWFFRAFNWTFRRGTNAYSGAVRRVISRKALAMGVYFILIGVTFGLFKAVPSGFVPAQDKQYLVGFAQLPDGATLDRTEDVIRRMGEIALKHPGVENAVSFPGLSINGFTNGSNSGIVFTPLKSFDQRKSANLSGAAIAPGRRRAAFMSRRKRRPRP
jgi:hypothetical protein